MDRLTTLASQRAVVIFSNNSCCMSHTIKALFRELGVNPAIYELDEDPRGREIERALQSLGCTPAIPAVFIGGRLMTSSTNSSSTKEIMQLHLEGSLVPLLRSVGAIWL